MTKKRRCERVINFLIYPDNRETFILELETPDGSVTIGTEADNEDEARRIIGACMADPSGSEIIRNFVRRKAA